MEIASTFTTRKRIGELLIDAGIIRAEELPVGLEQARERQLRLGEVLVLLRFLSAEDLEAVLHAQNALQDGALSELRAVEALKIASSHRITFDQALTKVDIADSAPDVDSLKIVADIARELDQAEKNLGPEHRDLAPLILKLGDARTGLGQHAEAEKLYRRVLVILEKSYGPQSAKVGQCLIKLADCLREQNRLRDAESTQWKALQIVQESLGNQHLDTAKCHRGLAAILEAAGCLKEAEQFYLTSLRILEKVYGADSPEVTDGLRHLAMFWSKQGKRPERKRIGDILVDTGYIQPAQLEDALEQCKHKKIPLGQALVRMNAVGEEDLRSALQAQLLVGDGVLPLQLAEGALRSCRGGRMAFQDALRDLGWEPDAFTTQELKILLQTADELMTAEIALGADHAGVALLTMKLGDHYVAQKKYVDAEPLYKRAIAILEKFFGNEDQEVSAALLKLGRLYVSQNKLIDAEKHFWRALEIRQAALGEDHADVAEVLEDIAISQIEQQNSAQAENMLQSALAIKEKIFGRNHPKLCTALQSLGDLYAADDRFDRAESMFLRLVKIKEANGHTDLAPLLERLGDLYLGRKDYSKAETQYELALEIRESNSDYSNSTADLMEKMSVLLKMTSRTDESSKMDHKAQLIRRGLKPA